MQQLQQTAWGGHWYIRQMDPPPSLHLWCIFAPGAWDIGGMRGCHSKLWENVMEVNHNLSFSWWHLTSVARMSAATWTSDDSSPKFFPLIAWWGDLPAIALRMGNFAAQWVTTTPIMAPPPLSYASRYTSDNTKYKEENKRNAKISKGTLAKEPFLLIMGRVY